MFMHTRVAHPHGGAHCLDHAVVQLIAPELELLQPRRALRGEVSAGRKAPRAHRTRNASATAHRSTSRASIRRTFSQLSRCVCARIACRCMRRRSGGRRAPLATVAYRENVDNTLGIGRGQLQAYSVRGARACGGGRPVRARGAHPARRCRSSAPRPRRPSARRPRAPPQRAAVGSLEGAGAACLQVRKL